MIRIELDRGLDIPLGGRPARRETIRASRIALLGADYPNLRPALAVSAGDTVRAGQPLFADRRHPEVVFTAPADGVIAEVRHGARRSLEALVIDVAESSTRPTTPVPAATAPVADLRAALLRAGLWPALRARPYDRIPEPGAEPDALFVTAIDTHPLAADPEPVIRARADAFEMGLRVLARLAPSSYLCFAAGVELPCPDAPGLERVAVRGPHPAGLPGTHVHLLARQRGRPFAAPWHVGYQDVIAIGELFAAGAPGWLRHVSVAGPGAAAARIVETLPGASLAAVIGSLPAADSRVISGSVLSGRLTDLATGFLGRYHQQVVVLPPARPRPAPTGMLPVEAFDRAWPLPMPASVLLRALLIEDAEAVAALGGTLLAPEDLALLSYLCPAGIDYGAALERTLERHRRGA